MLESIPNGIAAAVETTRSDHSDIAHSITFKNHTQKKHIFMSNSNNQNMLH